MTITITAFQWVPEVAQGFVRDLRPRWACGEIGLAYEERLIDLNDKPDSYYRQQPWGQVPVLDDDGIQMFESGAILLHLAGKDERLLSADPQQRASTISWLFAAFNSIEPFSLQLLIIDFATDEEWAKLRRPSLVEFLGERLHRLADALGDNEYLVGDFSVADIAMATALRETERSGMLEDRPILSAYLERCIERSAFQKALADQMAVFAQHAPPTNT